MRNEKEIKEELKEIRKLRERPEAITPLEVKIVIYGFTEALRWVLEGETKFPRDIFCVIKNATGIDLKKKKG